MTLYQPGFRGILDVGYGLTGQRITCLPEVGGAVVDPSSITVDVLRPGESATSPTIDGAAATEDATTHLLTYTLDASNTTTWFLGDGYTAIFYYTASSIARTQRVMFDVVRVPLTQHPPCNTKDVVNGHAALEQALVQESMVDGAGDADATPFIVEAWGEVVEWLRSKGKLPGRITSPQQLTAFVRSRARVKTATALMGSNGDLMKAIVDRAEKDEETAITTLQLYYDEGDTGTPNELEAAYMQPRLLPLRRSAIRRLGVVR